MRLYRFLLPFIVLAQAIFAHAEEPIFNLNPELELADSRLEMAQNAPSKYRKSVAAGLAKIQKGWASLITECADPRTAPKNLIRTKAYLQRILLRLTEGSKIAPSRLNTEYGVCVTPIEQPRGIFPNFLNEARLNLGLIQLPPKFLLKFRDEDELAFVLAHELSHFLLKHEIMLAYVQGTSRSMDAVAVTGEREADELGLRLVINAGYDVDKALTRLIEMRPGDDTCLSGSQLLDLRSMVMADVAKTKRHYQPLRSEPYLPREVMAEVQAHLGQLSAEL